MDPKELFEKAVAVAVDHLANPRPVPRDPRLAEDPEHAVLRMLVIYASTWIDKAATEIKVPWPRGVSGNGVLAYAGLMSDGAPVKFIIGEGAKFYCCEGKEGLATEIQISGSNETKALERVLLAVQESERLLKQTASNIPPTPETADAIDMLQRAADRLSAARVRS